MANERLGSPDITFAYGNGPVRAGVWYESQPIAFRSPWSGKSRRLRRWGMWKINYEWTDLPDDRARIVRSAFNVYDTHTPFKIVDVTRLKVTGNATDAQLDGITVNGPTQTGQVLNVQMIASPGAVLLFKTGDIIGMGATGEVYEVSADVTATGGGLAAVPLVQFIGKSPNDNERVLSENVAFKMQLTQSLPSRMQDALTHSFTAEMEEGNLP